MGLRLVGIDGLVLHDREAALDALHQLVQREDIALILLTTKVISLCPQEVAQYRLTLSRPLLVEIPDRHGSAKIGETLSTYIRQAIGLRLPSNEE